MRGRAGQRGDEPGHCGQVRSAAYRARPEQSQPPSGLGKLSERERKLATLSAQGRTNAPIAAQPLHQARTVSSHPDRIRDKTGCRHRADLTPLPMIAGLA
jgi:DNA-binding NarL/FixJ family response regulator